MPDSHRLLVTASRYYGEPGVIGNALSVIDADYGGQVILRHGKCNPRTRVGRRDPIPWGVAEQWTPTAQMSLTGGDWLAHLFATRLGWQIEAVPADWEKHHKAAGHIRSAEMIDPTVDECLALFASAEDNRGTIGCAGKAIRAGITTWCYCDRCPAPQVNPCGSHCRPEVIRAWHKATRRGSSGQPALFEVRTEPERADL